jgi:hypothetical protein
MKLFKYEGYRVVISEEALMLKPFKKIWDRDKHEDKRDALNELAFIYFYVDPRSDYQYITIPESRMEAIKEGEGLPSDWKPDKDLLAAINFYETFKPMSALLLDDSRKMINKLRDYINDIDFNEKDDKGKPIYTMSSITSTIKQIPELTKTLNEAERLVNQEMLEAAKARGSVELTIFDADLDI